jgi:hypothetical protein
MRCAGVAAPGRSPNRAPRRWGVSPSACSQRQPGSGSSRAKRMCWPALPRMPVRSSSSRHSAWRSVSPERAMEASAGSGSRFRAPLQQFLHRLDRRGGHGLDRERAADARLLAVHEGLVVERLLRRVAGDGRVDLPGSCPP